MALACYLLHLNVKYHYRYKLLGTFIRDEKMKVDGLGGSAPGPQPACWESDASPIGRTAGWESANGRQPMSGRVGPWLRPSPPATPVLIGY